MEKLGIKETNEVIAAMGELSVTAKKAMKTLKKIAKDGLEASDIIYINELFAAMPDTAVISAGVENADRALLELKELDQAEVIELIGNLYTQAKRFNEA